MVKPNSEVATRILDAARVVFLKRGTSGARMSEIAEEADVNQALLHYYFRSKARLAKAVFQRAACELFPSVLETLMSDCPIPEKVRQVVEIEMDILSKHPFLPGYVLAEMNQHPQRVDQFVEAVTGTPIEVLAPKLLGGLSRQIDAAVEAGEIRAIAPEEFVINLVSLCIFPFAARPLLSAVTQLDEDAFFAMIERRRAELPGFFLRGLRS